MPKSAARGRLVGGFLLAVALLVGCRALPSTATPSDDDLFDAPLPGLTGDELAAFIRGDQEFGRRFSPTSGLGPLFNNVSCASCHSGDGRGLPGNILLRIGEPANDWHVTVGGPQIQDKAIPGITPDPLPTGIAVSRRLPPPVFGMGLIEAIPDEAILAHADPDDANGDGISGRANWVTTAPYAGGVMRLGRFGRKAQVATLLEQTVEAYHQDIGITSAFRPFEVPHPSSGIPIESVDRIPDPEIPSATVQAVVHYLRGLAAPAPGGNTPDVDQGRALFATVGCASCHVPVLRTGPAAIGALAERDVELYSDLLLHDLGPELDDHRPDGGATGREWRTTPLWGLRVMERFLDGHAFLMHDGRASSVEEAIALHGGEAAGARAAYQALSPAERAALLTFVRSR
jgi:CxxC motif-containing protein (DUF1111 family)